MCYTMPIFFIGPVPRNISTQGYTLSSISSPDARSTWAPLSSLLGLGAQHRIFFLNLATQQHPMMRRAMSSSSPNSPPKWTEAGRCSSNTCTPPRSSLMMSACTFSVEGSGSFDDPKMVLRPSRQPPRQGIVVLEGKKPAFPFPVYGNARVWHKALSSTVSKISCYESNLPLCLE